MLWLSNGSRRQLVVVVVGDVVAVGDTDLHGNDGVVLSSSVQPLATMFLLPVTRESYHSSHRWVPKSDLGSDYTSPHPKLKAGGREDRHTSTALGTVEEPNVLLRPVN
ncbi:hypothetical protein EYF80_005039 [Liparis tanakae]|uniref:Uncharacterized protein n=1 Tax=Liparis tanakae TaxID=230148 RepID=A0A4Z2J410_9TELE|nr:hypothetical protein EYF80_005039 [Liparis tanakae]